jgi:serine/threonine protein kinase/Tol biopolymer transport system component
MGEVYRARDPRLGREVAIKVLPASFSADADRLRRFEQEARAAGILNHPNLTAVHDIGTHEGAPYVVQELLEGETLRSALSGGKLSTRRAIDYSLQIVHGLAAAHEKGIVHRDLKPENIFVTSDGRVKILDFGLAKLTQIEDKSQATNLPTEAAGTEPGVVLGTLGYMSPEQVRGKPADARSDIFSFGAILYEMLSGRRAFHGDSAADTMSAILKEDPPDLSVTNQSVPPGLDRIVRHCLEKSPERRFHSAHDIAFDLESLSSVSQPGAIQATQLSARRRLPGSLLTVPALALGLLAGYLLWKSRPVTAPSFHRLTYRRGVISGARFVADGQTAVYSSQWEGGTGFFSKRLDNTGAIRLDMKSGSIIAAMSPSGEMLILHDLRRAVGYARAGTLARAPVSGGSARDLLEDVSSADLAPDGQTMAVVLAPNWRYRLEFPPGKTLYETAGWIGQVRVSPHGDEVAILDHPQFGDDRGGVSLIDRAGKRTVLSTGWSSAQGIAWSPDGNEIWFTASDAGSDRRLWAVSRTGKKRFIAASPGEMSLMDISKAGQILFLHGRQQIGVLALAAGETRERDLSAMDWSRSPILSNDGKTMVFSEEGEGGGPGYSVFLVKTDGSSTPTRLGEGEAIAISSDGKWVLAGLIRLTPIELVLLPTGAGEPRHLKTAGLNVELYGSFLPGDKTIVFGASALGHPRRTFELDLSGGDPKPVSPEGMPAGIPSPDGKQLIVFQQGKPPALLSREDGAIHPIPGAEPGDNPLEWSSDGRSLFLKPRRPDDQSRLTDRVVRLDLATGRRETWRDTRPADTSAMTSAGVSAITPDGKTLAFTYTRNNNDLYAVDGWK